MGEPRNVGGVRARCGGRRRRPLSQRDDATPAHYITSREAGKIARRQRAKDEQRGIFRRWNDRKLKPEEMKLAAAAQARAGFHARRRRKKKESGVSNQNSVPPPAPCPLPPAPCQ